jgi:hypothetical protein
MPALPITPPGIEGRDGMPVDFSKKPRFESLA